MPPLVYSLCYNYTRRRFSLFFSDGFIPFIIEYLPSPSILPILISHILLIIIWVFYISIGSMPYYNRYTAFNMRFVVYVAYLFYSLPTIKYFPHIYEYFTLLLTYIRVYIIFWYISSQNLRIYWISAILSPFLLLPYTHLYMKILIFLHHLYMSFYLFVLYIWGNRPIEADVSP